MNTLSGIQTLQLEVKQDNETGENGLLFADCPVITYPMVALEGLLLAHDFLEHQNGLSNIGSIDDELEALGGVWFVRGQHGALRQDNIGSRYSPQENLASDVLNMAVIYNNGVEFKTDIPAINTGHDLYETFYDVAVIAYKGIRAELELEERNITRLKTYIRASVAYMLAGYDKAVERYKSISDFAVYSLFFNIAQTIDETINNIELIEGQKFELTIDWDDLEVTFNYKSDYQYMFVEIELDGNFEQFSILCHNDESFDDLELEELEDYLENNNLLEYDSNTEVTMNRIEEAYNNQDRIDLVLPYDDPEQDFTLTVTFEIADI